SIDTNLINAGAYVLERDVLEEMPAAGTNVSIERDVFPRLIGRGLFGHPSDGYWLDIGTPERYLQGTFDIVLGAVETPVPVHRDGVLVLDGAQVAASAALGPNVVLWPGVSVGDRAVIERSVLLKGASVGASCTVRDSILGPHARIGDECELELAVLGEGTEIESGSKLEAGARIFPDVMSER
ncbi:MAG TPA: NDP-sugar synthase, partial [Solirubrobacteraceae bacterium]|nr:NDP-sugar synthase [Solirubrobacteraceae bacterium]